MSNIISGVSGAVGIIGFFVPQLSTTNKIILFLIAIISAISSQYVKLYKQLQQTNASHAALKKKLTETTKKHEALAEMYDEKDKQIEQYATLLQNIDIAFCIALQQTEDGKLRRLYDFYLQNRNNMNIGGNHYE